MDYLDKQCTGKTKTSYSGREWYEQEALRAVNQAIGRAIRHRFDYGFVVLADSRFASYRNREQLPKWLKSSVFVYDEESKLLSELSNFYRTALLEIDHNPLSQKLFELTKVNSSLGSPQPSPFRKQSSFSCSPMSSLTPKSAPTPVQTSTQKPTANKAALMALYGASSSTPSSNCACEASVFDKLEKTNASTLAERTKSLFSPGQSQSSQMNDRKRKFSVISPPGPGQCQAPVSKTATAPLKPGPVSMKAEQTDKENRIRQIAATVPSDKRSILFKPFLAYRKAPLNQNAIADLIKALNVPSYSIMLKEFPKVFEGIRDILRPTDYSQYNAFLRSKNISS